jgi:hypothetical protein
VKIGKHNLKQSNKCNKRALDVVRALKLKSLKIVGVPNIVVSPTFLWRTARLTRLLVVGVWRRPWGAQIGGCEMQATLRWHWTYNRKVYSQTMHFLGVVKPCACVVTFGAHMFRSRSSKVIVSHIAHSWGKCGNMGECSRRCPLVSLLDHNNVGTCEFGQGQQTWEQICEARVTTVDPDNLYLNRAGVHPLKTHLTSHCNPWT